MASLKIVTDQPDRLVLSKGKTSSLGGLIGILIFGAVACLGLSGLLGEGDLNPVMIAIFIIIGVVVLISAGNAVSNTIVTLDAQQRLAARSSGLFFLPTQQQTLPFNKIREVQVSAARGAGLAPPNTLPIWSVRLQGTDGSSLLVNDRGTRVEMDALAARVSAFLNLPVAVERASASTTPATDSTNPLYSLLENLGGFAGSMGAGTGPVSPTISGYPSTSPRLAQDDAERATMAAQGAAANAPYTVAGAQMAAQQAALGASNLQVQERMAAEQAAAGAATAQASARMAQEQADAAEDEAAVYAQLAQQQFAAGMSSVQTSANLATQRASAFSSDVQTQAQSAAQSVSAFSSVAQTQAQAAAQSVSAFSSDAQVQAQVAAQQLAAGMPFMGASIFMAQQQATAQAEMMSSLPPMMSMPYLPDLGSFAPALDMPQFAPLNTSIDTPGSALMAPLEIKEVKSQYTSAVIPDRPNVPEARTTSGIGRRDLNTRDLNKARDSYLQALSANPADSAAQNNLGVVYFKQNKMPDAERAFRRTIALDPFSVEGRYNLGLVLQRMGQRKEAQEQFRVGVQNGGEGTDYFQQALRGTYQTPLIA